jgi:hypothetical protein
MRAAAIVAGVVLPLVSALLVTASLPGLPPLPPLPQTGPVTILVEPPSAFVVDVPPPPTGCVIDISYDNSQMRPPSTLYRGQTACGNLVYAPVMSGHVTLSDAFGNVVSEGSWFGPVAGSGPDTASGRYSVQKGGIGASLQAQGPVPGLDYTITFTSSITLVAPQSWGPPANGCYVSDQTLRCTNTTTYSYIPGTKGGISPGS